MSGMSETDSASTLFARLVSAADAISRKVQGIEEFDGDTACLLRIGFRRARHRFVLGADVIEPPDRVIELHLWNEHVPRPQGRPNLGWIAAGRRQFERSLQSLADHLRAERRFDDVRAVVMTPALAGHDAERHVRRMQTLLGQDWTTVAMRRSLPQLLHQFIDDLWLWFLTKSFVPNGMPRARFFRRRQEFWISRERFLALYGSAAEARPRAASSD
jgi:hypothetical protein